MLPNINLFGMEIPSYGLCMVIALVVANAVAIKTIKSKGLDVNDFIVLAAFSGLGAAVGSKLLYLIVFFSKVGFSIDSIIENGGNLLTSGFVFLGGLLGGIASVYIVARKMKIDWKNYVDAVAFCVPMGHAIGRIGCFLAGCCYGREYHGILHVTYPEGGLAPSGVDLFPSQLLEMMCLSGLSLCLFIMTRQGLSDLFLKYICMYGVLRFFLEFSRGDVVERGGISIMSTSQTIAVCLFVTGIVILRKRRKALKKPIIKSQVN